MKIWSRDFTRTEKILLVVLFLLLFGYGYYLLVDSPVRRGIASANAEVQAIESEMAVVSAKAQYLERLQKELNEVKTRESLSRMESYNNSKNETDFLNKVLSGASDYSVQFAEVTRDGAKIRRSFSLEFVVKSYKAAQKTVEELTEGKYRCLVDDINYTLTEKNDIYIDLTATFFETMVGGTPDSALPKDEAKKDSDEDELIE